MHPVRPHVESVALQEPVGLDVVLVLVRPVEEHLLAIVRYSILLLCRVPPQGEKVAILVVAGEEHLQMLKDLRFMHIAHRGVGGIPAEFLPLFVEFPPFRRLPVLFLQAPGAEGIVPVGFADGPLQRREILCYLLPDIFVVLPELSINNLD
ncbi:hypothetical protein DSECCO2_485330 [anaerobic digester metagenome]